MFHKQPSAMICLSRFVCWRVENGWNACENVVKHCENVEDSHLSGNFFFNYKSLSQHPDCRLISQAWLLTVRKQTGQFDMSFSQQESEISHAKGTSCHCDFTHQSHILVHMNASWKMIWWLRTAFWHCNLQARSCTLGHHWGFSTAAVTSYHKLSGLNRHRFIPQL